MNVWFSGVFWYVTCIHEAYSKGQDPGGEDKPLWEAHQHIQNKGFRFQVEKESKWVKV